MTTKSAFAMIVLALAGTACASGGAGASDGREPEAISPVRLSGPRGALGGTELHNNPRLERRAVTAPPDAVWRVLPAVYRSLDIAEAGADTGQLVYGAVDFRPRRIAGNRLSRYIDCGMGVTAVPKADEYEVTMSVTTRLAAGEAGNTVVTTAVTARAKQRAQSGNAVYCHSQGTLEAEIIQRILTELGSDS